MDVYNHNILSEVTENMRPSFKHGNIFISQFIKKVCLCMNEFNVPFVEKFIGTLFYWFSLNYDVYNLMIDDEVKQYLRFFNLVLQKEILNYDKTIVEKINTKILPFETNFQYFIPTNRFFILSQKKETIKIDDMKEINYIQKIILIHFLNSFTLKAENNEEIASKFYASINIKETVATDINTNMLREKLMQGPRLLPLNIKKEKPIILLDACNIAMRHGEKTFSSKGIQIVMDYFQKNGHTVLAFLPEYLFRNTNTQRERRVVPDNIEYLNELNAKKLIVQTPAQDYDDSYCIQYCKEKSAYIVTNDLYRDYLEKKTDNRIRETERLWILEKRISFTFHQDEFMPNPDCAFFQQFNINEYSKNKS